MKISRALALILSLVIILAFAACKDSKDTDGSGTISEDVTINDILGSVVEKSGVAKDSLKQLESTDDLEIYYLINAADVKAFAASKAANSTESINEFVIVEAIDKDAAERVRENLQRRLEEQTNLCHSYSPEFVNILDGCKVEVNGNFVSMLICENSSEVRELYSSYFN